MIAWLWLACGSDPAEFGADAGAGPVEVRVVLDGPIRQGGGAVEVQVAYDPSGGVRLAEPVATGLTFTADGPPTTEHVGARDVVTQRYVFEAPSGSYEVPPLIVGWTGPDGAVVEGASAPLFVDVGVEPPRQEQIVDIVEPGAVRRVPWWPILAVGGALLAGLALLIRPRRPRVVASPPPVPPDVVALAAWDAARNDPAFSVDQKAKALSELFRTYVEGVLGFEASARTTFEILEHLGSLAHLPQGNVQRAKRILRATDMVKFAEARPGAAEEWLADLDADLRAFVEATRPVTFQRKGGTP